MLLDFPVTLERKSDKVRPTVYVRQDWSDSWTAEPYIDALTITETTAPDIASAELMSRYGMIKEHDVTQYATHARKDLDRWFVKIEHASHMPLPDYEVADTIERDGLAGVLSGEVATDGTDWWLYDRSSTWIDLPTSRTWYGLIIDTRETPFSSEALNIETGDQYYRAVGLEWLLTRVQVTESVIWQDDTSVKRIRRALPFNPRDDIQRGNAATAEQSDPNSSGVQYPRFAAAAPFADWTADQIVRYLLRYFGPGDANLPDWTFSTTIPMTWHTPSIRAHGRTLWDLLSQALANRRGVVWWLEVVEDAINGDTLTIKAAPSNATAVALPGGETTIPANPDRVKLLIKESYAVEQCVDHIDTQTSYEQIVAEGARRGTVASYEFREETGQLVPDWGDLVTLYEADQAGTDLSERKRNSDAARRGDNLSRVYTTFRIRDEWDGKCKDDQLVFPALNAAGNTTTAASTIWDPGLRFTPKLPLRVDTDYSNPYATTQEGHDDAASIASFQRAFAVAEVEEETGSYQLVDQLAAYGKSEDLKDLNFSCSVRVQDRQLGVVIRPSGVPHLQAKGVFPDEPLTDYQPQIDYRKMIFTGFVEQDDHVTAVYPATPLAARNNHQSTLVLRLHDQARLDYMPVGTVLGVKGDGTLKESGQSGFVRDDRGWLKDVARTAYEWYQTDKHAIAVNCQSLVSTLELGYLVESYSLETVHAVSTVITGISYNFVDQTSRIRTAYESLEVA